MQRAPLASWLLAAGVLLSAGCSTPPWSRTASKQPSGKGAGAQQGSPFKSRRSKTEPAVAADEDEPQLSGDLAHFRQFDEETLKMVEEELQATPPDQRQQLYSDLRSVDPKLARMILRNRKMLRLAGQAPTHRPQAKPEKSPQAGGGLQLAGGRRPRMDGPSGRVTPAASTRPAIEEPAANRRDSLEDLGTVGPWDEPQRRGDRSDRDTTAFRPNAEPLEPSRRAAWLDAPQEQIRLSGHEEQDDFTARKGTAGGRFTAGRPTSDRSPATERANPERSSAANRESRFGALETVTRQVTRPWDAISRRFSGGDGDDGKPSAGPEPASLTTAEPPLPDAVQSRVETGDEFERLVSMAEADVATSSPGDEDYVEKHVYLRMLYLMGDMPERALEPIKGAEPEVQEFWQQMFWGLSNYFDEGIEDPADRASQTVAQLRKAVQRLREKANLELHGVTFCNEIENFGNYTTFERNEFRPGQPVLVYAEVENFESELTADGFYRTVLKSTIEIREAGTGRLVAEPITFEPAEDLSREHRRDYFHSYEFRIPKSAYPGQYVMQLVVEDQLAQKVATYKLNFTVK